jgi:putative ABC transport system permease protein
VTVASSALPAPVTLPVAAFVDEPLGTFAYVSLPELEHVVAGGGLANTALLRLDPGAAREEVLDDVRDMVEVSAVADARGLARSAESLMRLFWVFVGIMLLFGGLMSFALMFNAMSANVAERSTEMATLRAAGVSGRAISGLLTRENLLVAGLGVVPGLLLGYALAGAFMASFSSDLFSFSLHVRWTTFVLAAAAMVLVALVSQWPALRAIGRLDVATVVRERSA